MVAVSDKLSSFFGPSTPASLAQLFAQERTIVCDKNMFRRDVRVLPPSQRISSNPLDAGIGQEGYDLELNTGEAVLNPCFHCLSAKLD
jgi:hypothetical protein